MVLAAQWDREFVAYLSSQRFGLRKFEVVRITRRALADHAWLRRNKAKMGLAPLTRWFGPRGYIVMRESGCEPFAFRGIAVAPAHAR